jgi:hypothetical protein
MAIIILSIPTLLKQSLSGTASLQLLYLMENVFIRSLCEKIYVEFNSIQKGVAPGDYY